MTKSAIKERINGIRNLRPGWDVEDAPPIPEEAYNKIEKMKLVIDVPKIEKEQLVNYFGCCSPILYQTLINGDVLEDKVQGEWIEYKPEHGECPFCGDKVDLLDGKLHRFCSECGAKLTIKEQ